MGEEAAAKRCDREYCLVDNASKKKSRVFGFADMGDIVLSVNLRSHTLHYKQKTLAGGGAGEREPGEETLRHVQARRAFVHVYFQVFRVGIQYVFQWHYPIRKKRRRAKK